MPHWERKPAVGGRDIHISSRCGQEQARNQPGVMPGSLRAPNRRPRRRAESPHRARYSCSSSQAFDARIWTPDGRHTASSRLVRKNTSFPAPHNPSTSSSQERSRAASTRRGPGPRVPPCSLRRRPARSPHSGVDGRGGAGQCRERSILPPPQPRAPRQCLAVMRPDIAQEFRIPQHGRFEPFHPIDRDAFRQRLLVVDAIGVRHRTCIDGIHRTPEGRVDAAPAAPDSDTRNDQQPHGTDDQRDGCMPMGCAHDPAHPSEPLKLPAVIPQQERLPARPSLVCPGAGRQADFTPRVVTPHRLEADRVLAPQPTSSATSKGGFHGGAVAPSASVRSPDESVISPAFGASAVSCSPVTSLLPVSPPTPAGCDPVACPPQAARTATAAASNPLRPCSIVVGTSCARQSCGDATLRGCIGGLRRLSSLDEEPAPRAKYLQPRARRSWDPTTHFGHAVLGWPR